MQSDDEKAKDESEAKKKPNPWESKKEQLPPQGPPPLDQFFKDLFKKLGMPTNITLQDSEAAIKSIDLDGNGTI